MSKGLRRRRACIRELARLRQQLEVARHYIRTTRGAERERWQAAWINMGPRMAELRAIVYGNECGEPRFSDETGLRVDWEA